MAPGSRGFRSALKFAAELPARHENLRDEEWTALFSADLRVHVPHRSGAHNDADAPRKIEDLRIYYLAHDGKACVTLRDAADLTPHELVDRRTSKTDVTD